MIPTKSSSGSSTVVRRWRGLALLLLTLVAACWPTPSAATPAVIAQPPVELLLSRQAGRIAPSCAGGSTLCEDPGPGYPTDLIKAELAKNPNKDFFGNDTITEKISARIDAGHTTLCGSQTTVIYPSRGQNTAGHWLFIINVEGHQQAVIVETCSKENSPCMYASSFPKGTGATCRQKYMYRKLLAMGKDNKPTPEAFRVPSCCECFVDSAIAAAGK